MAQLFRGFLDHGNHFISAHLRSPVENLCGTAALGCGLTWSAGPALSLPNGRPRLRVLILVLPIAKSQSPKALALTKYQIPPVFRRTLAFIKFCWDKWMLVS